MSWIVVRVRSNVNVERSIRETMDYLTLQGKPRSDYSRE